MKLKRLVPDYVKFWHNKEEIDIPEYKFNPTDVRGCWISNVANIDTPKLESIESYKKALTDILDRMVELNMNLAIFQVRPANDAYYESELNPWSQFITGTEGKNPGFDILEFFCTEAKKRNIKVHAWMNPYRVSMKGLDKLGLTKEEFLDTLALNNYARLHKDDTIVDGDEKVILSPSHPSVIKFVTNTVMEVATKYDVDGVHIDDYFYPYGKIPTDREMPDYIKYKDFDGQTLDDFRRSNVNKMIKSVHDALSHLYTETGKKVQFGISPFGIYRTNKAIKETGWEEGSYNVASALEAYSDLYSDVYKWMEEGWIDYVVPQDYFSFERRDVSYHDIAWWWSEACKKTNTTLYLGLGFYHLGEEEGWGHETWQNPLEISNQLAFNCNYENIKGVIMFTYHDLVPGKNAIKNEGIKHLEEMWNPKN